MSDIVERLREPKSGLSYTDSTMRTVSVDQPDSLHLEAASEIERLREMVAAENEACAKLAEENTDFRMLQDFGMQSMCDQLCSNIALAIRARSPREETNG